MTQTHVTFDAAFKEEFQFVRDRWRAKAERRGWTAAESEIAEYGIAGLALSGGGIRSASFCMGVVQQLHVAGVLDRMHYMSTVSGGGYTGTSLTWFMTQEDGGAKFGTEADNFPFWGGVPAATRNAVANPTTRMGGRKGPLDGRVVLDYIRQRASYLNPGAGFTLLSALAIVLRSVLTSLLGYVLVLALLFTACLAVGLFDQPLGAVASDLPKPVQFLAALDWLALGGVLLLLLLALSIVGYSFATGLPGSERAGYAARRAYQRWAGVLLGGGLGLLLVSLVYELVAFLNRGGFTFEQITVAGGSSTIAGTLGGFLVRSMSAAAPTARARLMIAVLPPLFLLLLITGLAFIGAAVASYAADYGWGVWLLLIGTLLFCTVTNINLTGLHRFYRDRLMESFLPDPVDIPLDAAAAETDANEKNLAEVCRKQDDGPYHLINAHVVLAGSKKARQRSRKGDSFLLSPLYCGSEATGYVKTDKWLPGPARFGFGRRVGAMKLATAMAISGAALNPRTGADGQGGAKGGAISALLNLLNLRLGYWVPSPRKVGARFPLSYVTPPNFLMPGLVQGLVGSWHDEDAHWIELSDGGHFENTGLYELVRRGARTIVFADGSTDPEISLSSLANVLEKIFIDFGAKITFSKGADFVDLLKGTAGDAGLAKRLALSKSAFAIATIDYRDGPPGRLFYVKSTLIEGLPASLYSYKAANPLFPSESLAEQFFSEQQFEAYRTLGFLVAAQMVQFARGYADLSAQLGIAAGPAARLTYTEGPSIRTV